ncbi:MAG: chemotaxis response regulator protein-glutamate methylesterase [Candidatus Brocadia sp. AMX2]|uniref:Protein-glutamate methylesterase/protein-glutamine glutaminase n=1 Tax=Candidatus Brocadia sinica JPN1 TaxID=1197129 RepID=A0ABQ0K149_9BACT|nr:MULTISPECIES: chemotaxis response regulator protein-glutamate methylesterase [Brocadia]KXK26132.1 MAG: chemotaxis response regulator protein (glutamate methylesterase) [Candidatus Brocadia sinica]MBC6933294.1 chemotaxis response regulator protein-glutamate methylesterase [Candidatus Brocadia sp.]MBL1170171.1 chemotaxis response regulator protein-glutamate methylesterase [Candidatus Brocadia sp. AMX1]NOG42537.1 chemotaxis response regulator protein-glutamate methylesterase [Planctomycetota ba
MVKKIKVLIVDDSAVVRKILSTGLSKDHGIEVVGTAADPFIARDKIINLKPDVITLDVEMPRMDGISFLQRLMTYYPLPVIMVSSLTQTGCETTLKALEVGALDFVAKPSLDVSHTLNEIVTELAEKIKESANVKVKKKEYFKSTGKNTITRHTETSHALINSTHKIIAIGASTGGTEALKEVLMQMPPNAPGILIVQHMPQLFTKSFADRLNSLCSIEIREAKDGDSVIPGLALIAPGNYHMELRRNGARYYITTNQEPPVRRHRPSVEVLFESVAKYAGSNAVGVIMTGMGDDGASGLLKMKESGAKTLAQDEESCVVFGMPKEAIKLGAVDTVVPLNKITPSILSLLTKM